MQNKRSQIAIFIILAILVIAVVALFFAFKQNFIKKEMSTKEVAPIRNFVQECVEERAEITIKIISEGGGYYFPPKFSTNSGVTYYLKDEKNYMPSKKQIENEISENLAQNILGCAGNFSDFPDYIIERGNLSIKTAILNNKIDLDVNYPLTIKKENSSSLLQNFDVSLPARIGSIYDSVQQIVNSSSEDLCLSCIAGISLENELSIDTFDYENNSVIFTILDNKSIINREPLKWVFAIEY